LILQVAQTSLSFPEGEKLLEIGARIAITLLMAWLAQRGLFLLIGRFENLPLRRGDLSVHAQQRAHTLGQIVRSMVVVLVGAIAFVHILDVCGWDVKPLLAGAGILGVALGFGAQWLVRDVIAGVFILLEDQFAVGDLIEMDGRAATVEEISVRSTRLRDFNGYVHFVPNGSMKTVTNRSRGWNRLAVDVPIDPNDDAERALEACRHVAEEMNTDPAWKDRLLEPVQLWGIEQLDPTYVQIRLALRARPGADTADAARELRRRVHRALTAAGVRLAGGVPHALSQATRLQQAPEEPDALETPS
jgi:small conductance mechanosensitive channel